MGDGDASDYDYILKLDTTHRNVYHVIDLDGAMTYCGSVSAWGSTRDRGPREYQVYRLETLLENRFDELDENICSVCSNALPQVSEISKRQQAVKEYWDRKESIHGWRRG